MIRIGIDPGASGAIVVLNDEDWDIKAWELMPTVKVGKASRVNGAALSSFLRPYRSAHVFLEKVHSMPQQGVSSTFTFGHAAGLAEGVVQGLEIPYTLIPPQSWKKRADLIGTNKDAARARAIQLWPGWRMLDTKIRGQALADAALIARFGK